MAEQTPTQDEINRVTAYLIREECENRSHHPDVHLRTLGDPLGTYTCGCGRVTWMPKVHDA